MIINTFVTVVLAVPVGVVLSNTVQGALEFVAAVLLGNRR